MNAPTRRRTAAIAGTAALTLAAFGAGPGAARQRTLPALYVNYTMSCTFTITNDAGAAVTSIAPGSYDVEVNTPTVFGGVYSSGPTDMNGCGGFVQFQLTGPGVNIATTLDDGDSAQALFSANFEPNSTYTAVDDNQPSVATATFTTLASGTVGASTLGPSTASISSSGKMSAATGLMAKVPDRDQMTALFTVDHQATSAQNVTPTYAQLMGYVKPFEKILAGCKTTVDQLTDRMIELANQASVNGGRDVTTLDMLQAVARRIVWKGREGCRTAYDVAEAHQEAGEP